MCIARRKCEAMSFKESDCRRENSFYSIGGLLCHNQESSPTNCENGTTIFAVNINGETHTDKRGIFYKADNEVFYEDKHNTRMDKDDAIQQVEDLDKKLYGSYAVGEANGRDKGQCLYYSTKVEDDGDFELALSALEPMVDYDTAGKRVFSLFLNQVPIALHVDLGSLSNNLTPVDIVTNFRIEKSSDGHVLVIKGHHPMNFTGNVHVGLCISDCWLCEEYSFIDPGYVGSGLSLVRF